MRWFKLFDEIIDDPKIRLLSFEDRWHYVALMCCKNMGIQDEVEDLWEELLRVKIGLAESDFESLKKRLLKLHLIDDCWNPLGWDKRQVAKDASAAERQRKYREKQKKRHVTHNVTHNVTATSRVEEEVEVEKEKKTSQCDSVRDSFDAFWSTYPKKVGKKDALTLFRRLPASERQAMLADDVTRRYKDTEQRYIHNGDTYVRKQLWQDEIVPQHRSGKYAGVTI
jgi:hypothetical protein